MSNTDLVFRLGQIRLIAMDVDGVLTEGGVTWSAGPSGELAEQKTFNVKDGLGISLARAAGLQIAWITGRVSPIVERRAAELGVQEVCQWARDKQACLEELARRLGLRTEQVLYIGDDVNDLPAFAAAGVTAAPSDAAHIVLERADWITQAAGGRGAAREVIEGVLHAQDRFEDAVEAFLARLRSEGPAGGRAPGQ